jgi:hypothetical protein
MCPLFFFWQLQQTAKTKKKTHIHLPAAAGTPQVYMCLFVFVLAVWRWQVYMCLFFCFSGLLLLLPKKKGRHAAAISAGLYVSAYRCMCPHTAIYVSSYCCIFVLILLYMCPHTAVCASSYCYVSSYCYICVRILLCALADACTSGNTLAA